MSDFLLHLSQQALWLTMYLVLPVFLAAFVVSVVTAILSASTKISDHYLQFVPRFVVVVAAIGFTGSWVIRTLIAYSVGLWEHIPDLFR